MLGINFASLGNDGNTKLTYNIQEISGDFTDGDEAQIWDNGRYVTVVYYSEEVAGKAGFYNLDGTLSTLTLSPGTALWLKSSSLKQATLAGKVLTGSQEVAIKGEKGWSLFASRTPIAIPVNDFVFTGLSDGDELQLWDGTRYTTVVYYSAEMAGVAGFYELNGQLSTRKVPVGSGFWIKSSNVVTME